MLYQLNRQGQATQFVWKQGAGPLRLLGTYGEAAEMAYSIIDHFSGKRTDPIPELTELPESQLAPFLTVPEAVASAMAAGLDTDKRRLSDSIRSAAREGRIAGAYRTAEGYWRLPVAACNAWIAEHAEQRRGRPRKKAAQ